MIIVPNIASKQQLESLNGSETILLLSEYLSQLLSQTSFELATDSIVEYSLLKKVDINQIDYIKKHIHYIYEHSLCLDALTKDQHPNTKWVLHIAKYLSETLKQSHLIHPAAIIVTLINSDIDTLYLNLYHYGFEDINESIRRFLEHFQIQPYHADHPISIATAKRFSFVHEEVQHAINWHINTEDSAILLMNTSPYTTLLAQYEFKAQGCLPKKNCDTPLIHCIQSITAPHPYLAISSMMHLIQTKQYPEGFLLQQCMLKSMYNQSFYVKLDTYVSYIFSNIMQSNHAVSANTFIEIIDQILIFWRMNTSAKTTLGKHLDAVYNDLHSLMFLETSQSYEKWHTLFSRRLQQGHFEKTSLKIFDPKSIQGARIENLWVLGAQSENWVVSHQLPALPRTTHKSTTLSYVKHCAKHIIYSLPNIGDSGEKLTLPDYIKAEETHPQSTDNKIKINHFKNWHVSETIPSITGGVSLIQDYATCPFKAFARQRLKLSAKTQLSHDILPHHFGTITHDVLETLYQDIKQNDDLATIKPTDITSAVEELWHKSPNTHRLHQEIQSILKQRLIDTVITWIEVDKQRKSFTIKSLESKVKLTLNNHQINIRIDRIDQINGQDILIDYKTGRANLMDTFNPAFTSPQMALYTLSQDTVPTIAYAKVMHTDCCWQSVNLDCDTERHKALVARHDDKLSFEELKSRWETQASICLQQYEQGIYPAKPNTPQACDQCDFQSLCRIYDQGVYI